ncbi:peroxide stress protein YaaA [Alcanivorax sp. JB21]|uniref:peroxide stress protein YaaA n=1 Tax=Alcanivorax limicola TaxID=2874102 RepID=UPI001CBC59A1|nr:peroxide stress protein YaaA [Alcanivorax limicola]MBZ2187883.1 peroxide stress protein YaaA [Alcanivorax limicola]
MLIVVSPAKTLDYTSPLPNVKTTRPRMLADSAELVAQLRDLTPGDIGTLMGVSDKIAALNATRFASWQPAATKDSARPAVFAFKGDVYTGLDVTGFDADSLARAQSRLRILSGLYGLLRPLDMMRPYRLEMGTRLANERGKDLYQFWDDRITDMLAADMKAADTDVLINLASNEYFRAVRPKRLKARIITPVFEDEKNGQYKVISFYAKKARGLMAAWILQHDVREPERLTGFDVAGYRFHAADSDADRLVFRRREKDQ